MSVGSGRVDANNRGGTMSAVTFGEAHANAGLPFTVEELDRLPDDGRRYELTATTTEFAPDVVVVPIDEVGDAKFTRPPLLVVEVRSPSTAIIDLNRTKTAYERFGVPSYWIVDPDPAQPEVSVFELRNGRCVTLAVTTAPLSVERPFPVTITPAHLTSRLRPRGSEAG
jgi:hypothetical protein